MPTCFVRGCKSSDYQNQKENVQRKISLFRPSKEEVLKKWQEVVPNGENLKKNHVICELHFDEDDVLKEYSFAAGVSKEYALPKLRARLKDGALPKIFKRQEKLESCQLQDIVVTHNFPTSDDFQKENNFVKIYQNAHCISLPSSHWFMLKKDGRIFWNLWNKDCSDEGQHAIEINSDMKVKILLNGKEVLVDNMQYAENVEHIVSILEKVSTFLPCANAPETKSPECTGYTIQENIGKKGRRVKFCNPCKIYRIKLQKRKNDSGKLKRINKELRAKTKNLDRRRKRISMKVNKLKEDVRSLKLECSKVEEDTINKCVEKLPLGQQFAVKAILSASKVKNIKGIRYESDWIYECILLRIKGKRIYEHLRKRKILALPSITTLNKYLKLIKSQYGFQQNIFEGIKLKTKLMPPTDVHGCLLLDEMKLSKLISFNKMNLKFEGFTNLGDHTPENQKGKAGDHALVLMFQPFKGKWVQSLGCFLSKGCASGTILHKLIMECIILAENAGLKIDAVVTDGASWNRTMWSHFGVSEEVVSVEHIVDSSRRLWFISDFPHLIKCIRNFLIKHALREGIWTPDGIIALIFWFALLECEDTLGFAVKANFKFREEHLRPKFYQKMNVALAIQFFGVADLLELFKNKHPELEDCEPAIRFCKRWKALINAMNVRTPMNALKPGNESYKIIQEFILYLDEWQSVSAEKGFEFMTENSFFGLKVSLKAALEISEYLVEKCGFSYLMTARLNQDSLERFFGMMRESCGANDHPDSRLFIQLYRLISTYSLIQPPKGSNVASTEIFDVLLKIKDTKEENERKEKWEDQLDTILDSGSNVDALIEATNLLQEHDYCESEVSRYANAYVAGYVARKASSRFAIYAVEGKRAICEDCCSALILSSSDPIPERHKLITLRSKGYLKYPSVKLCHLIDILESAVMSVVGSGNLQVDTLFEVTRVIEDLPSTPFVGCTDHCESLTRRVISFYLTTRMYFLSKHWNKINNERERTKENRKLSKLATEKTTGDGFDLNEPKIAMKKRKKRGPTAQPKKKRKTKK